MYNQLDNSNRVNILFIHLGNICRSLVVYIVMQHLVEERDHVDRYMVDFAGIGNWHVRQLPDKHMREHGRQHGYNVDRRTRQFNMHKDFGLSDKIVVMDEDNYCNITSQASNEAVREEVIQMTDFLTQRFSATRVPDPYYGDAEDFNLALDLIEDSCGGIPGTT